MPTMTVPLTVPVKLDGALAFEFEAAVDVQVTYWGCRAQVYGPAENCYPAEGPEWEVKAHYVDCGTYVGDVWKQRRYVADYRTAPDWAVKLIDEYLETREAGDFIAEHIMDERSLVQ